MKKLSILIVTIFMLCLTLTACQDNTPLEGYWVISEAEIFGKKVNIDKVSSDGKYPFISFEENSQYVVFFVGEATRGKWERTGKGVKLLDENSKASVEIEKSGDKLVMRIPELEAKYVFTKSKEKSKAYDEVTEK